MPYDIIWWILSLTCLFGGLAGTIIPFLPGTSLIFLGVVLHRVGLGPERSISWWAVAAIGFLLILSIVADSLSGAIGAKRFGSTRWGVIGAMVGAFIGIFFGLPGLFLGPLIGALVGELAYKRKVMPALRSGYGTIIGTGVGLVLRVALGAAMVAGFFAAWYWNW